MMPLGDYLAKQQEEMNAAAREHGSCSELDQAATKAIREAQPALPSNDAQKFGKAVEEFVGSQELAQIVNRDVPPPTPEESEDEFVTRAKQAIRDALLKKFETQNAGKPIYQSLNALEPVKKILAEAGIAVKDKARTIKTSDIPEVLGAVAGAAAGVGIGIAAVSAAGVSGLSAVGITSGLAALGGLVGGTMVAGIFVAGAPMALLGVGGYALLARRNRHRLMEVKDTLYKDALVKHDAIIAELNNRAELTEERVEYLNSLNILLRDVIGNLEKDLKK